MIHPSIVLVIIIAGSSLFQQVIRIEKYRPDSRQAGPTSATIPH